MKQSFLVFLAFILFASGVHAQYGCNFTCAVYGEESNEPLILHPAGVCSNDRWAYEWIDASDRYHIRCRMDPDLSGENPSFDSVLSAHPEAEHGYYGMPGESMFLYTIIHRKDPLPGRRSTQQLDTMVIRLYVAEGDYCLDIPFQPGSFSVDCHETTLKVYSGELPKSWYRMGRNIDITPMAWKEVMAIRSGRTDSFRAHWPYGYDSMKFLGLGLAYSAKPLPADHPNIIMRSYRPETTPYTCQPLAISLFGFPFSGNQIAGGNLIERFELSSEKVISPTPLFNLLKESCIFFTAQKPDSISTDAESGIATHFHWKTPATTIDLIQYQDHHITMCRTFDIAESDKRQ